LATFRIDRERKLQVAAQILADALVSHEMGLEGIISKRKTGRCEAGRTDAWTKSPWYMRVLALRSLRSSPPLGNLGDDLQHVAAKILRNDRGGSAAAQHVVEIGDVVRRPVLAAIERRDAAGRLGTDTQHARDIRHRCLESESR
jgi:hypothetical protein